MINQFLNKIHPRTSSVLQLLLRLFLGWVFIQSGWEKLQNMHAFVPMVLAYKVLPDAWAVVYAKALPWLEILAGGYLVIGLFTRYAAAGVSLMMFSFIIAISLVLIRGDVVDCGCFVGGKVEPVDLNLLLRDIGLIACSLYLSFQKHFGWSIDAFLSKD